MAGRIVGAKLTSTVGMAGRIVGAKLTSTVGMAGRIVGAKLTSTVGMASRIVGAKQDFLSDLYLKQSKEKPCILNHTNHGCFSSQIGSTAG